MDGNALAFFASEFYGKKEKNSTYSTRRKDTKKIKIAEEEDGLEPERVHAHHLDLRLTP